MLTASCQQAELHEMVQIVARGVTGRSSLPILNNIYLEASEQTLRLLATDMEHITIEGTVDAQVAEEGAITINARILSEVAGGFGAGEVSLQAQANNAIDISSTETTYKINALPPEDFPTPPAIDEGVKLSVPQNLLREVLEQTIFATSRDETRPILTGALFHISPDNLEVVATDTYRLALRRAQLETGVAESRQAIVSARALNELARVLSPESDDPIEVVVSDRQIEFTVGTVKIGSRLIEGEFPKYEKVIPESHEKEVWCAVADLEAAIRRVLIVARDDANRVVFHGSGSELTMSAQSSEVGQAQETIAADLQGEEPEVAFNARYLVDMLEVCPTERLAIWLSGPLNPGTLVPEGRDDYTYVLMPMQIM